ncbi:MAG TPA: PqqD family protein [Gemmatimonadaceae bacterium]|nr:PqqD family protein [Gemmatimonadaceae bacterium]
MDHSASYTVSNDVLTAHLEDEAVLLHMDTKRYYRLNSTAAAIWRGLEQGKTRAQLLEELCRRFDVTAEQAAPELDRVVLDLVDKGLLTPSATSVRGDA